jgi:hypothetical protein
MSIVSREQLKAWFRRGMKPLESQFATWIDSFWHKEDSIPMTSIDGLGEALNARTISIDAALDDASENPVQNKIVAAALANKENIGKVDVDAANHLLKVKDGNDTYVCGLELLAAPAAPTVSPSTAIISSTETTTDVTLSTTTAGATIRYTLDGTDPRTSGTAQTGTTVHLPVSMSDQSTQIELRAAAQRNGVWSSVTVHQVTTCRKVKRPVISASGNDYSTSRTVTITCATTGATIKYSLDGTDPIDGEVYSGPIPIDETTEVQAVADKDGWATSADAEPKTYTVGAKKAYYGFSTASALANEAAIKALIGGGTQDAAKLQGALTITPTGNAAGYIWLCCTGTLTPNTIVPNQGDVIPFGFESAITVDGWNCYRSTNAINPVATNVYVP